MEKLLELISGIDTQYTEVDSSFQADIESRNKKAFDHIALFKVIKGLIAEIKLALQKELAPLSKEREDIQKELGSLKKELLAFSSSIKTKKEELLVQIEQQERQIQENDTKISRTERIIASNAEEIAMSNDNRDRVFTSVQQIQRELIQAKADIKKAEDTKTVLLTDIGQLTTKKQEESQRLSVIQNELAQLKHKANMIDPTGELLKKISLIA